MMRARPSLLITLGLVAALGTFAGCAGPQAPPPKFYQLRLESPAETMAADPAPADATGIWQLVGAIPTPDYLDHDVLWLPVGQSGLQPLPGHRWAEPLSDAVPRIVLHDLAQLHGAQRVWAGSVPSGLTVTAQLRLQILDLAVSEDLGHVHLHARCTASDPQGGRPARVFDIALDAPSAGTAPDQLVAAHRLALWQMARQIDARMRRP